MPNEEWRISFDYESRIFDHCDDHFVAMPENLEGWQLTTKSFGISGTAGVLRNKSSWDVERLIMMRTKLRELRALALHIIKMPLHVLEAMSPINHGHLEMTKAIHCHFLRVWWYPPDQCEWQVGKGFGGYRHPSFSQSLEWKEQTRTSTRLAQSARQELRQELNWSDRSRWKKSDLAGGS